MSKINSKLRKELVNGTLSDVIFSEMITNDVLLQRLDIANPTNVTLSSCLDSLITTDDNCYLIPLCFLMTQVRAHSLEGIEHVAIVGSDRLYCPRIQIPDRVFKVVKTFMSLITDIHPISQVDFWFAGVMHLKSHTTKMPNSMYRLFIVSGDNFSLIDASTGRVIDSSIGQTLNQLKNDFNVTVADFGFIHNVVCIKILKSDADAEHTMSDEESLTFN